MITRQLEKTFGKFEAVKNLSLGMKRNECFGLLGPNGAGKTTTISMLTREVAPSNGDIILAGKSIWSLPRQGQYDDAKMSCCLQFESLSEYMTGREHLKLYLQLRRGNLDERDANNMVETALIRMNLVPHADKYTYNFLFNCSG